MAVSSSDTKRRLHTEYAEALEADAKESDEACTDLVEAASYWHLAGDHEREEQALRSAIEADDGLGIFDGRIAYAAFLLTHDEREEGERLLTERIHAAPDNEWSYLAMANAYMDIGEPKQALRWHNVGIRRFVPNVDEAPEMGEPGFQLLRDRAAFRHDLGLPTDAYDELAERTRLNAHQRFEEIKNLNPAPSVVAVLYWPEQEFAVVQREHPDWYPDTSHSEHRRDVQRALEQHHPNAEIAVGSLRGLTEYAGSQGLPVGERSTRSQFAAEVAGAHDGVPWPPGRNDQCWCGSARKYKKCCGAPGFI